MLFSAFPFDLRVLRQAEAQTDELAVVDAPLPNDEYDAAKPDDCGVMFERVEHTEQDEDVEGSEHGEGDRMIHRLRHLEALRPL